MFIISLLFFSFSTYTYLLSPVEELDVNGIRLYVRFLLPSLDSSLILRHPPLIFLPRTVTAPPLSPEHVFNYSIPLRCFWVGFLHEGRDGVFHLGEYSLRTGPGTE